MNEAEKRMHLDAAICRMLEAPASCSPTERLLWQVVVEQCAQAILREAAYEKVRHEDH